MNESTQMGDSPVVTDVDSAAQALMQRYSNAEETQSTEPTPEEDEVQAEETETEEVEEESGESKDAEESEAETFESLSELADATGMELDDFLKSIKARTKVDGEESEVTLADLIKGYQLESTFTRKNEAFLAQQKQWQEQQQKAQARLQADLQKTGQAFQMAQQQLTHEYQAINWEQLKKDEPEQYLIKQNEFGQRQAQLDQAINQATQHAQRVMQQQREQQAQQLDEYTKQQDELLLKALPQWQDSDTRKAESEKVAKFLSDSGYTPEEIGNIRDHRVILMAVNAMKGKQAAESADIASKQVKKAPKLLKPNARQNVNQAKANKVQKLVNRAKATGRTEDVAAALLARRG